MGYILFSSEDKLSIHSKYRCWDSIIEYSYDNKEWIVWNGEIINNNLIYMRGVNNTIISDNCRWLISGKNIKCQGNIENLLDYKSVINNVHPLMKHFCFGYLFFDCKALIEAPQLLSTDLAKYCYLRMFDGCASLTTASMFPNFTVAKEAIINNHMFENCTLTTININNKLYNINVLKLL